ncbi:MAG: hypothetical protein ACJ76I_01080 [Gaiellaceae bacterium]
MTFALQLHRSGNTTSHAGREMHLRLMIEAMIRDGHSESEIAAAVERAQARP